jgi:hypothetical protein
MSNLTAGIPPQPFGKGGRKVTLPVKATTQIWQGGMVAQPSGACRPATSGSETSPVVGVAEHDELGGASDGTKRISLLTDQIFVFNAGSSAPTDATLFGSPLFAETDNTVGTSSSAGTLPLAGYFAGMEDDGKVRIFIGAISNFSPIADSGLLWTTGANLADTATQTVNRAGVYTRFLLTSTMTQDDTVTLGTTGAIAGDIIRINRNSTSAHTLAVVNGGTGAGTIATLPNSKVGFVQAYFDGTDWKYDGSTPN